MNTIEVKIDLRPKEPWDGILIAQLSELGFDGFLETRQGICAYAEEGLNVEKALKQTCLYEGSFEFEVHQKLIPAQNWNAQWEADFEPVYVDDRLSIMAPFHDLSKAKGLLIQIQPQMSFGTGHHQTTWLMSRALINMSQMPDRVLDMGSGTGVLAIIAEKRGANEILAIDIEEGATENARSNVELNKCSKIIALQGDIVLLKDERPFGLILANINKNVLKAHMSEYARLLEPGGTLLLSGFFESDVDDLVDFATKFGLQFVDVNTNENWAMIQLKK